VRGQPGQLLDLGEAPDRPVCRLGSFGRSQAALRAVISRSGKETAGVVPGSVFTRPFRQKVGRSARSKYARFGVSTAFREKVDAGRCQRWIGAGRSRIEWSRTPILASRSCRSRSSKPQPTNSSSKPLMHSRSSRQAAMLLPESLGLLGARSRSHRRARHAFPRSLASSRRGRRSLPEGSAANGVQVDPLRCLPIEPEAVSSPDPTRPPFLEVHPQMVGRKEAVAVGEQQVGSRRGVVGDDHFRSPSPSGRGPG